MEWAVKLVPFRRVCRLYSSYVKQGLIQHFCIHTSATICDLPSNSADAPAVIHAPVVKRSVADDRILKISKAMKAYLQRAKEHEEFMKVQKAEFELGKRHLANIMGKDPEHFTQEDIDQAVAYLMPSGLFVTKARPMMKPPEEIFPKRKAAEFDESGRPFHFLFYTVRPNYYKCLYDIVDKMEILYKVEDEMIRKGVIDPPPESAFQGAGSEWIKLEDLEKLLLESVPKPDYEYLIISLERLIALPYSAREKEFINKFRKMLTAVAKDIEIPTVNHDENGRPYVNTIGWRKAAKAMATIWADGTGKIKINGEDIDYFADLQDRMQIMFPLQFTNLLFKVDIEVNVEGGGHSGQAGAARHAIAQGLSSLVPKEVVEKMRIAGLLTQDVRTRERKKPGQKGARAKFTWKKR